MWAKTLGSVCCKPRHHRRISNEFRLYATNHSKTRKRQGLKDREQIFNSRKRISISISFSITLTRSLSRSKYVYYLNMGSDGISMCVREKSKRLNRASCWLVRYLWISYCYRKSVFSPVVSEFLFLYEMNGFRLPCSGPSQQKSKIKFELIWPFVWLKNLKLPKIVGHFTKTKYRHRHRHRHTHIYSENTYIFRAYINKTQTQNTLSKYNISHNFWQPHALLWFNQNAICRIFKIFQSEKRMD